jgi:hypothetical protein
MLIYPFIIYLGRILPLIVNLCPPRESPDFETIIRPNGTTIELGYSIKKSFNDKNEVIHLKEIYGILYVSFKFASYFLKVQSNNLYSQIKLDFPTN